MKRSRLPFAALLALALTIPGAAMAQSGGAGAAPASAPKPARAYSPIPDLDRSAMDPTADPCVDFYQYACGNFSKLHPIPSDMPVFDEFANLEEYNLQLLHGILESASAKAPPGSDEQKIHDYYGSCMDTAAINRKGLAALQPELSRIDAVKTRSELAAEVARLQKMEVNALLNLGSQQDFKNATLEIAYVDQGGLGLPEKDYYLRPGAKSVQTRRQYVQHLTKMLKLMGEPQDKAAGDAQAVMDFETSLAKASMGAVDRRDPKRIYHFQSEADLSSQMPQFDIAEVLRGAGVPPVKGLNVAVPDFFKGLNQALQQTSLETVKTYLRLRLVESEVMRLPAAFDEEHFNFYGRQLQGTPQQQPRWKRCVEATDASLGEDLGKFYVQKYFAGDSKAQTLELVKRIEAAMQLDLEQLDWMSPETKTKAEEKLHLVANKIGYPDKWRDYSKLDIKPGDALGDSLRSREFEVAYELNKIGKPVNRSEWEMSPPTVNAYYDPSMNDINFPAGILQPAFYDKTEAAEVNDGHIGAIIGHELTHGFDDEGSQFDGHGNLVDWWTDADAHRFQQRTSCLVKEYDGFTAVDELHVNGKLTLGENTADNGGMRLAFMALMAQAKAGKVDLKRKQDGLTALQRFFIGFGQNWCSTERPQFVRMLVQVDPHSPDRIRANGVVRNMPEFGQAFACRKGQPMYPAETCRVW
jgi:endothelin-converting enzyme/putative endopeptidase